MTSYYVLLNKLETFFNAHLQVKKFGGEFREQMPNFSTMDERYPLVYVVPTSETSGMNTNVFTLEVYCVDIIQKDRANINTILSDCQLILNDLYLYYTDGSDLSVTVITDPTMTPLNNFDLDYVAGWVGTFTFEVDQYSVCAIPLEPIIPVTNECPPSQYLVEYENGTDIQEGTIPSGGSLIIQVPNPTECLPATVELINTASTLLLTESVDCGTTEQIIAPDGIVHLKKENDGTITNVTTPSGATTLYVVQNNDITVNQAFPFEIHATDPLNIRVHNPQGADITPQSVVYQGNSNHVTITINPSSFVPVGATLMKTGQTTSYRTGDDGDIEAGRATSFTVLASNNPFGNTNRFTDELGGQTYTNNIAIDWSTYNGSNVLGISRINIATGNTWNQAIDNSLSYSIGSFTTGWRLPNIREIFNLLNFVNDQNNLLNYSPFNLSSSGRIYWSSTTIIGATTFAYALNNIGLTTQQVKTSSTFFTYFPVRTFTVTGTTLT
jgi:hypothetical protein